MHCCTSLLIGHAACFTPQLVTRLFKAIPRNKSYRNEKNHFTKKNYKKKEIAENQNTEPESSSSEEEVLTTDNEQDFQAANNYHI